MRSWDLWSFAARGICLTGLVGGVLVWGVVGVLTTALVLVFLCWWLLLIVGVSGRHRRARIARRLGLGLTGAAGLVAAAGVVGFALLVLLAVFSPLVGFLRRSGRWTPADASPQAAQAPTLPSIALSDPSGAAGGWGPHPGRLAELSRRLPRPERLADLDDPQLCLAWRQSFLPLSACHDIESLLELVELREKYLDELTRRHPAQMARWLASGARAAGNPMPFIIS